MSLGLALRLQDIPVALETNMREELHFLGALKRRSFRVEVARCRFVFDRNLRSASDEAEVAEAVERENAAPNATW